MRRQLRLLRYAWPHWRSLVVVLLTMLVSIGVNVLRPWPFKILLDQVLGHHAMGPRISHVLAILPGGHGKDGLILWVSIGVVALFALGTIVQMINTIASVIFGQRMTYDLGADLFLHVQRLSLLFHSRRPVGDTIARVTGDPYCVQELVTSVIVPLLSSLITILTIFAIMLHLNVTMTLISLAVVPFLALSIRIFRGPMRSRTRQRRDLEGAMMSVVEHSLSAVPAVQSNTREEQEHERFRQYADSTVTAFVRATYAQMWFQLAVGLVTAVGMAAIMYVGARYALEGKITPGTIVLFLLYLQQLYQPLNAITFTAATYQSAGAKADRVMELLDLPLEVADSPRARDVQLRGDIRYDDVSFSYEPGKLALDGISLEARPGEVVAIVGPTGAGKTTLVSLLVRFFQPASGRLSIDGVDLQDIQVKCLRQQIAIVLQDPFIFPYSIAENIAYGRPGASRHEIVAAAVAANADDFIRRLPDGYDTVVGERGTTLSGGEKQRLSLARAFLKDAPILILDEPTSALDARTEARLLDALERLMQGRTTIIIAHRLSTIRNADRILVLDRGRIIEQGHHEDLMVEDGLYSLLYRQQMDLARHGDLAVEVMESTSQ